MDTVININPKFLQGQIYTLTIKGSRTHHSQFLKNKQRSYNYNRK